MSLESIDLGGGYTCLDDIINLMNIVVLQDYSKYNPLFKKVKDDTSRDICISCSMPIFKNNAANVNVTLRSNLTSDTVFLASI